MSRTEQRLGDDTLARLFWSRVELSKDLPAQIIKRDGQWPSPRGANRCSTSASAAGANGCSRRGD
jgi:hypothetical protein